MRRNVDPRLSIIRGLMALRIRHATLDDSAVLVRQRLAMFADMGAAPDEALGPAFAAWLQQTMPAGVYRGWLLEADGEGIVAGGGATLLPWPPGPSYPGGRLAYVYNVYTEPGHRHRGYARKIMDAIHDWCAAAGINSIALNASESGKPLYESMGYRVSPNPTMFRNVGTSPRSGPPAG